MSVLHFQQMSNTLTIRRIAKMQLERAQKTSDRPFLRLAGVMNGPPGLSTRKGFSRK